MTSLMGNPSTKLSLIEIERYEIKISKFILCKVVQNMSRVSEYVEGWLKHVIALEWNQTFLIEWRHREAPISLPEWHFQKPRCRFSLPTHCPKGPSKLQLIWNEISSILRKIRRQIHFEIKRNLKCVVKYDKNQCE